MQISLYIGNAIFFNFDRTGHWRFCSNLLAIVQCLIKTELLSFLFENFLLFQDGFRFLSFFSDARERLLLWARIFLRFSDVFKLLLWRSTACNRRPTCCIVSWTCWLRLAHLISFVYLIKVTQICIHSTASRYFASPSRLVCTSLIGEFRLIIVWLLILLSLWLNSKNWLILLLLKLHQAQVLLAVYLLYATRLLFVDQILKLFTWTF